MCFNGLVNRSTGSTYFSYRPNWSLFSNEWHINGPKHVPKSHGLTEVKMPTAPSRWTERPQWKSEPTVNSDSSTNQIFFFSVFPVFSIIKKTYLGLCRYISLNRNMGMDQYLLIPFLVGWTSIYQLFWCSPGVQGFDTLPYEYTYIYIYMYMNSLLSCSVVVSVLIPLSIFQPAGWCGLHRLTTNLSMSWTRRLVGSFAHSKSAKNLFMFSYRAAWRLQIASWPWFTSHQLLKEA